MQKCKSEFNRARTHITQPACNKTVRSLLSACQGKAILPRDETFETNATAEDIPLDMHT